MGLNPPALTQAKKELPVIRAELGVNVCQDARGEQLARPPLRRPALTRALSTEWIISPKVLSPPQRRVSPPVLVLQ